MAAGVFAASGVLFGAGMGVVAYFTFGRHQPLPSVIGGLAAGLVFGGAMTIFVVGFWRNNGGRALQVAVTRAVRTGNVPADADADSWLPVLSARLVDVQRWRNVYPILFFGIAAVDAALIPIARDGVGAILQACSAAVIAALAIVGLATRARREQRILTVMAVLDERDAIPSTRAESP